MADSFKLTDGTTTYELQYDSATQTDYRLKYNSRIQVAEPDVLVHVPDDGESLPVRAVDRDRQVFLTVHFPSGDDTWDDVLNNVTKIKRMVDGAHSQALRYWLQGDVDRVVLRVQKDGATNYTDLPVKWGFVDDSNAYYTEVQEKWGWQIVIMLTVGPYGEGASIFLRNDLPSSPHFIEDSNSDGLADGWTLIGTPTDTIDTTYYLVGGKSQKLVTDTSTSEGIVSDVVSATVDQDVVMYVWVHATAGDPITIALLDGTSAFVTSVEFNPANPQNHDKTATGAAGETWYRHSLTSTSTRSNANVRASVSRTSTNATQATTFYVDLAYLEVNQSTVPDAWSSHDEMTNMYDPATNEDYINYIDLWGVPGDAPAIINSGLFRDFAATQTVHVFAGKSYRAAPPDFWVDSTAMTTGIGTWSTGSLAGIPGGDYRRTTADGRVFMDSVIPADRPINLFLFTRAQTGAPTVTAKFYSGDDNTTKLLKTSDAVAHPVAGQWSYTSMGSFDFTDITRNDQLLSLELQFTLNAATYFDIAAAAIFDISAGYAIVELFDDSGSFSSGALFYYQYRPRGFYNKLQFESVGDMPTLHPLGETRLWLMTYLTGGIRGGQATATDTFIFEPTIIPRTRHLLGTV